MRNQSVTVRNIKSGKTVYILNTDGKGRYWLNKQLVGRDISRKDAIKIASLYARSPLWLSRRKALSHLRLYSPMATRKPNKLTEEAIKEARSIMAKRKAELAN